MAEAAGWWLEGRLDLRIGGHPATLEGMGRRVRLDVSALSSLAGAGGLAALRRIAALADRAGVEVELRERGRPVLRLGRGHSTWLSRLFLRAPFVRVLRPVALWRSRAGRRSGRERAG